MTPAWTAIRSALLNRSTPTQQYLLSSKLLKRSARLNTPCRMIRQGGNVYIADLIAQPQQAVRSRAMTLFHFHHPVAHTNMCLNILRGILRWFQLLPKGRHENAQRGNIIFPAPPPNVLGEERVGQYLSSVFGEQAQQLIFDRGQMQLLAAQVSIQF